MSGRDSTPAEVSREPLLDEPTSLLRPLLERGRIVSAPRADALPSMVIGELLALLDEGQRPLIRHGEGASQETLEARCCVDLGARDVGCQVALMYEQGDRQRPVVIGVMRGSAGAAPTPVELQTERGRLVVSAKERLVLRCGKASITLTAAGKILVEGSYVSTRASGVNRIWGGSVEIN